MNANILLGDFSQKFIADMLMSSHLASLISFDLQINKILIQKRTDLKNAFDASFLSVFNRSSKNQRRSEGD